jgi:hypothetical protein
MLGALYLFIVLEIASLVGTCFGMLVTGQPRGMRTALAFSGASVVPGIPLMLSPLVDGGLRGAIVFPGIGVGIAVLGSPLGLLALVESGRRMRPGRGEPAWEAVRAVCALAWMMTFVVAAVAVVYT